MFEECQVSIVKWIKSEFFSNPRDTETSPLFIAAGLAHVEVCLAILDYNPCIKISNNILFDHLRYSELLTKNPSVKRNIDYHNINWKKFDDFLGKVIMKLHYQNKFIPSKYKGHFGRSLELTKLRKKCERELGRMKATFVQDFNFSLFDFFTESLEKSSNLLSNNAVVEAFRKTNFKAKFPLNADLIMIHFEKSLEKREFLDDGKKCLQTLFPELAKVNLIDRVFDYFVDKDICRLFAAFEPKR